MSLRSPLSRVLGSGSAKEGTDHWWHQRLTAVALLILGAWFLLSLSAVDGFTLESMRAWVARPGNAVMLILVSATLAWHSSLGIQVVIEDYVHGSAIKVISLILNKFIHAILGVAAVLAVLKVVLGGAA